MGRADVTDMTAGHLGPQAISTTVKVALSTTTATSALLPPGLYEAYCATKWQRQQGGSTITATTDCMPVGAGERWRFAVTGASDGYMAGILASGTDTLYLQKIG